MTRSSAHIALILIAGAVLPAGGASAQETTGSGAGATQPEIDACRASGLIALRQKSATVKDVSFDSDTLRVIKVNSAIEDVLVKAVVVGDAYIERKSSDKAQTFVCIVGDKGKVLLTIFSNQ